MARARDSISHRWIETAIAGRIRGTGYGDKITLAMIKNNNRLTPELCAAVDAAGKTISPAFSRASFGAVVAADVIPPSIWYATR